MVGNPGSYGVSQVQFADGTTWTAEELVAKARFINGTSGNDSLRGSDYGEVFDGKGGDDSISGGGGADTFIFNQGYGQLWIYENQSTALSSGTVLKLGEGLDPSTVTVTTHNGHVIIRQGTDEITLSNMANSPNNYGVSQVHFADGTTWTASELVDRAHGIEPRSISAISTDALDGISIDSLDPAGATVHQRQPEIQLNQLVDAMAGYTGAGRGFANFSPAGQAAVEPSQMLATSTALHH